MHLKSSCSGDGSRERTATEVVNDSGNGSCIKSEVSQGAVRRDEGRQPASEVQEREK